MYDEKRILDAIIEKNPLSAEYENLIRLARKNYEDGVIVEPRGYWVTGAVDSTGLVSNFPSFFLNGEDFPVRITHITACPRILTTAGVVQNPLTMQRIGMRFMFHDQWYMNMDEPLTRIPLWINKAVGASNIATTGTASWRFDVPFILSAKDSMQVSLQLEQDPTSSRSIGVGFTGIGLLSKRPYFWYGERDSVTDTAAGTVSGIFYTNDGMEPVAVTDMSCHVAAQPEASDPSGNVLIGECQIRQVGNGTQSDWFSALTETHCPMGLLGMTTGRAAVHRLPGDGWLMEPGAAATLDLQQVQGSVVGYQVAVGLFGYIMVS